MFSRRSTFLLPLVAVVVALSLAAPASASTRIARAKLFHFVNDYRHAHGLRALRDSSDVDRTAQHHSEAMATQRLLFHSSSLQTKLRAESPSLWGENIGMGPSIWWVYNAWTRSSEHRQNMLRAGFRRAGIGVVWAHGAWWITMIYYG